MAKKSIIFLLLCALIVPSYPSFSQQVSIPKNDGELKILSWNIFMLPRFVRPYAKRKRAKKIAEVISREDQDIIIFQEAFHSGARRILKKALKDAYPHMIGPVNHKPFWVKASSGLWVISKIPLTEVEAIDFKECTGGDCLARKGAVLLEGEWTGQTFQLVGTHLEAGAPDSIKYTQFKEIRDLMNRHKKQGVPQMLGGDFNMGSDKPGWDTMIQMLGVTEYTPDSDRKFSLGLDNDIRLAKGKKNARDRLIDFIFYEPNGVEPKVLKRNILKLTNRWSDEHEDLSNHYAVEAVVKF